MQRWQRQEQQQHANNSEFVLNQPVAALSGESYSFHGPGSSARANLPLPTMFSELQHEVSSLLEFKNALLETFPHLQSRMSNSSTALAGSSTNLSGSTGELGNMRRLDPTLGGSTGQLNRVLYPQPYVTPGGSRHLDVVSSDDTQPSWQNLTQVNSNGQASSSGVYSGGPPGSNNVGSLGRHAGQPAVAAAATVMHRRLHDSGFSPDPGNKGTDVRWTSHNLLDQELVLPNAEDELMHLLDLIHAKSEKLKSELVPSDSPKNRTLQAINEDELEVEQLRRERFMLLQRVAELESGLSGHSSRIERGNSNSKELTGNVSSATGGALTGNESESSISGIVHSVHIRTGQQDSVTSVTKDPSSSPSVTSVTPSSQPVAQPSSSKKTNRSISQSDLLDNHQVHIEIKNMSKSQEVLNNSSKARSGVNRRSSLAMTTPSVSVVNLKHGSADNLPQMSSKRFISNPNKASNFGQPSKSQMLRPNALLPGRMVMGIKARTGTNPKLKSHSVENLIDPASTVLGLKPANSEMNIVGGNNFGGRRRLSGTTSELNVNRIGTSEKVKVFETLEGVTSLPAELTKGIKVQVKPDRDKIRTILGMTNVIELQRHLLTTVMENEVYKTQLERVSDGWSSKMANFERLNSTLRNSLTELQSENNELKSMMNKKVSELDSTKARLRLLLDQSVVVSKNNSSEQQKSSKNHEKTETTNSTTTKSENHRVHFDLNNATTNSSSAENIRKPARTSRPNGRSTNVHLPSDARQKLEQLASAAGVTVPSRDNPPPIRLGSPIRSNLDPIQEMTPPALSKPIKKPSMGNPTQVGMPNANGGQHVNNNNNNKNGPVTRVRRESVGSVRSRPTTPSGRDNVRTLNLNNLSKSQVELPTEQASPVDLMNSMEKKDSLVAEDLSQMGRDTIASLIAGIIQRNSLTSELTKPKTKEAFVDSDTETDYTDVTLSPAKDLDQPRSTIPKPLFSRSHNGFQSLPHSSSMKSRVSNSWEANNLMEEMTHGSHVAFHRSLSGKSPHSSTMDLDSLSARYAEDSLNFDLQEVAEEDSLAEEDLDLLEHDSLQPKAKTGDKKKLIIPYNESFSSTTSVFTTSQDGSLESTKNQTEEDSLTIRTQTTSNVTLNMVPLKPWLHHQPSNQPLILGPEYQPSNHLSTEVVGAQQPLRQQPQVVPAGSSSLMKLATERMKKKFLGWS